MTSGDSGKQILEGLPLTAIRDDGQNATKL